MKATPEILSLAVRAGLVRASDVLSGTASVIPATRTNGVHRLDGRGRVVAYAKQSGVASRLDGDDVVSAERFALKRLRPLGLTPPLILQGRPAVVWTGPARGQDLASLALDEPSAVRLSDALGRALARLHRTPAGDDVPRARAPWPLLPAPLPSMTTHPPDRDRDAVLATWQQPAVRTALRPLAIGWAGAKRWTHGDLSPSNVIVDEDGRVTFIDLESAGRGDPCWDLVTIEQTLASVGLSPDRFRRAYGGAGGFPHGPRGAWHIARALVTAWQHAAQPDADNHPIVERLLDDARRSAQNAASSMQEDSR